MSIRIIRRTVRRCSFCFESGHTVMRCNHVDINYLFHEFIYFYENYGEEFLCNNLTVLFHPNEAQALLYHPSIKQIRIINRPIERMVIDVMMPRTVSNRYLKLHKKIVSMANLPRANLEYMNIIAPSMNQTIEIFQSMEDNPILERGTVLVGYDNLFTANRHARFRRYDYDIDYDHYASIPLMEGVYDYPDYIPPPLIARADFGRYGRARVMRMDDLFPSENVAVNLLTSFNAENTNLPLGEEEEPEWLEARPPRNVTVRRPNRFVNGQEQNIQDAYQNMFEQWSAYSRIFEDTYKHTQPDVVIEVIPQPLTDNVECPICMTEVESKETVSLGCCVYSFCGDCYSNQYLSKEHRAHQCMMCRTPFSKIQVYQESMADKLKPKTPIYPVISQLTELDDDIFDDLPDLIPHTDTDNVITEFPPNDFPMTLSELI